MANSRYFNEEGEPLLTAAQAHLEDEIEAQEAEERLIDAAENPPYRLVYGSPYYEAAFRAMGCWPA